MKLKRLSAAEFERVSAVILQESRIDVDSMPLVRAVLVDQQAPGELAKARGVTKQAVSKVLANFRKAYAKAVPSSMGFATVEMELPERLAFELDTLMSKAKDCESDELRTKAIGLVLAAIEKARGLLRSGGV